MQHCKYSSIFFIILILIICGNLSAKRIIVPTEFDNISDAISYSQAIDTIYVKAGMYKERFDINKSVNIIGASIDSVIVSLVGQPKGIEVVSDKSISLFLRNIKIINLINNLKI